MKFHQILQDFFIGLGVDWVLWLLVGLSLFSVALIVERWLFFLLRRVRGDELDRLAKGKPGLDDANAPRADSMERHVVEAVDALIAEGVSRDDAEAGLEIALRKARQRYERGLTFLATLGNNAPFVGLLGTVIGIMAAFFQLANITEAAKRNQHLMTSISEALVATAMGILVAIPAVAFYNVFRKRVTASIELSRELAGHRVLSAYGDTARRERETGEGA